MTTPMRLLKVLLVGAVALGLWTPASGGEFKLARIYIEYNSSANDLGFHVTLDGEDWRSLKIVNPRGTTVFQVEGKAGYRQLGMTELFFEGAEPNLDDFPLEDLLALFPEGGYKFTGTTTDGATLKSTGILSHAVPAGPDVAADVDGDEVTIHWSTVTGPPDGFPEEDVEVVAYQILCETFQVTLPAGNNEVELPEEFVESLEPGEHQFEVLAIDVSGNQTITEGSFEIE